MDTAQVLAEYTIEDIYNLPDGQRAELIEGQLLQLPYSPSPAKSYGLNCIFSHSFLLVMWLNMLE